MVHALRGRRPWAALSILAVILLSPNLAAAQSDPHYLRLSAKVKGAL